jgi:dTDP-4-dehydrorhamnose 3,5-epimerase
MVIQPKKDISTVTAKGQRKIELIDGVVIRKATTHTDDRGTLCEIYDPSWGIHPAPIVFVYQYTIRPGRIKGWHQHHLKDDRLFLNMGEIRVVLYDERPDSPTCGTVNELFMSHHHRELIVIPAYVWHAVENIGQTDVMMVSVPTVAYDHENPDVYRLPPNNDRIPYQFENRLGG